MRSLAEARGVSVARIALAWALSKPFVTSVLIGAKRVDQLDDNLGAFDVIFTEEERARLDAVSALPPEYPGWLIERQSSYRQATPPKPTASDD